MEPRNALEKLRSLPAQAAALIAVVVLTYLPTVRGQFLWDDNENIVKAAVLRSAQGLWRIWAEPGATVQYYPLTHTTFWLEFQAWGLNPLPYHVANIALHATSAVLLWVLLRRLEVPGALLGTLIWAVHPLQAESVAWIIERKNCLSGALALGSVLVYEGFLRAEGPKKWRRYAGALALFVLALLSKTAVVGVPIVMIGIAWWKYPTREPWARRLAAITPFVLVAAAAGATTGWLEVHFLQAYGPEFAWTPLQRLLIASHALWFYVAKIIVPAGLMFMYPTWNINPGHPGPWVYVLATVAASAALILLRKKTPRGVTVAVVSYVVLIAPALGLTNVYFMRFAFAQNHFQYYAGMAVCGLLGAGLWKVGEHVSQRAINLRRAVFATLVAVLSAGCLYEGYGFLEGASLYERAIRRNPDAWMAHYNLGVDYLRSHRSHEATPHFLQVLRIRPDDIEAMTNLGAALAEQQRYDDALVVFEEVLRRRPGNPEAHFNVGLIRDRLGDGVAAVQHLRRAVAAKKDWTRAERMLAWILATDPEDKARNGAEAVELAGRACSRTRKSVARCLDTLAAAYAEAGRFDEAVKTAKAAEQAALGAGEKGSAESFRARLALYESGKPYRRQARTLSDD